MDLKVGSKIAIHSNLILTILDENFNDFLVRDHRGYSKWISKSNVYSGEFEWEFKPRGKIFPAYIGEKGIITSGVVLTVVEVLPKQWIIVEDECGNRKKTTIYRLREGVLGWEEFGVKKVTNLLPSVEIGRTFEMLSGVTLEVIGYNNARDIIVKDSEGNSKSTTSRKLKQGKVEWSEFGAPVVTKAFLTYKVGDIYNSKRYGNFEILCAKSSTEITVRWQNTGFVQVKCQHHSIKHGTLKDKSLKRYKHLDKGEERYYVYMVYEKDNLVYIGKGTRLRYLHVNSGTSHCKKMNEKHFQGVYFTVKFFIENVSNKEASSIEKMLIVDLKPDYNTVYSALENQSQASINV